MTYMDAQRLFVVRPLFLPRPLFLRFLPRADAMRQRMQIAEPNTRLRWAEWVLTATGLEDVFTEGVQWETLILGVPDSVLRPLFHACDYGSAI